MSQELLGEEIGGYLLQAQIGAGGNGVVYRAIQPKTKKIVAIKILLDPNASASNVNRLFEEARAIRQINHPNIVELYDFQTLTDGSPYLVMELLQGENLDSYLKVRRRLHTIEALEICIPVAEALDAAHQKSIIHRDMKPDNIFLVDSPKGRQVKLLDFGIAKFAGPEDKPRITQSGILLGTPQYMSPEQAERPKEVDGRSDLYALGVILYEMVTGQLPFDSETPLAILFLHFEKEPTPPSQHVPGLSSKMERLILRCLAKSPAGRHPHARAFLKECNEILQAEKIEALKRTKAASNDADLARLKALLEEKGANDYEDDATSVAPASDLEEILELEEEPELEIEDSPQASKHPKTYINMGPVKTNEESGLKPFSRSAWLGVAAKPTLDVKNNQELARLINQSKPNEPFKKVSTLRDESLKPAERILPATRLISKPITNKPNTNVSATPSKPSAKLPETQIAIPTPTPNKQLDKDQKSDDVAAFVNEDDVLTSPLSWSPGPKTIQAFSEPDPIYQGPRTLLMTTSQEEEQACLRLTISPPEAQLTYWINEALSRPEELPTEIWAPTQSVVEIAVVARGFAPKQVTFLVVTHQEVAISLERPAPKTPTPRTPGLPPTNKR
jgi:serine/threonine protein kinase